MRKAWIIWPEMHPVGKMLMYTTIARMEGAQFLAAFVGMPLDQYMTYLCGLAREFFEEAGAPYHPTYELLGIVWKDLCDHDQRKVSQVIVRIEPHVIRGPAQLFLSKALPIVMRWGDPAAGHDRLSAWKWDPMWGEHLPEIALQSLLLFQFLPEQKRDRFIYNWDGPSGSLNPLSYPSIDNPDALDPEHEEKLLKRAYVGCEADFLLPEELKDKGVEVTYNKSDDPSLSIYLHPKAGLNLEEVLWYFDFIGRMLGDQVQNLRLMTTNDLGTHSFHGGVHILHFDLKPYLSGNPAG